MSTIPDYCPMCLRWMSQHVNGRCPDSVRDRLTLIARDVHQYDGGAVQALTGVGAQRIADVILAQFEVTPKGADRANGSDDGFGRGVMPEGAKRIPSAVTDRTDGGAPR